MEKMLLLRPELLSQYANLKEVRDAGQGEKGEKPFRDFVAKILIPRAEKNLDDELYDEAANDYRNLYRKGFNSPEVLYGLARSSLGDFAFSASEKEKRGRKSSTRLLLKSDPSTQPPGKLSASFTTTGNVMTTPLTLITVISRQRRVPKTAKRFSARSSRSKERRTSDVHR